MASFTSITRISRCLRNSRSNQQRHPEGKQDFPYFGREILRYVHYLFYIFPYVPLLCRIMEQITRVIGRHHLDALVIIKITPERTDGGFGVQNRLGCNFTQGDDHFRLYDLDLLIKKTDAFPDFLGQWVPVAREVCIW